MTYSEEKLANAVAFQVSFKTSKNSLCSLRSDVCVTVPIQPVFAVCIFLCKCVSYNWLEDVLTVAFTSPHS